MNGEAKSVVSFAFAFGLMEGMSSDVENDLLSSDEEGKHNVEIACSARVRIMRAEAQGLARHFSSDVIFIRQNLTLV